MSRTNYFVDFLVIEKWLDRAILPIGDNACRVVNSGPVWSTYKLLHRGKSLEGITVKFNGYTTVMQVIIYPPYFRQGHNLFFYKGGVEDVISDIEEIMQIRLDDAEVKEIEFGVVIQPDLPIQQILRNHHGIPKCRNNRYENTKGGVNGIESKGAGFRIKMYDPWRNYGDCPRKLLPHVRPLLLSQGRHKGDNSLKFEFHYTKPEKLNNGRQLTVYDVMTLSFDRTCRERLLEHYRAMSKRKVFSLPDNKNDADAITILFLALILNCENAEKAINDILSALFPEVLNSADKYSRKCSINNRIKKLKMLKEPESLEELLKKELGLD